MGFRFNALTSEFNIVDGVGTGTVTSVGLSSSSASAVLSVSGSPITTSGTFQLSLISQSANKVFASPDGAPGTPTFRQLVAADVNSGIASIDTVLTANGSGGASWVAASGGSPFVGAVYRFNSQVDPGTTWAVVSPPTQIYESSPTFVTDPSTNWLATVPSGKAGLYSVGYNCYAEFSAGDALGAFQLAGRIHYGASLASETRTCFYYSINTSTTVEVIFETRISLADGDQLQFEFIRNTSLVRLGSSNAYDSRFWIMRLGDAP